MVKFRKTVLSARQWLGSSPGFPAVLLGLIALLAFGLLLPRLGFYWDDWAKILVSRLFGLSRYTAYYAEDRPLSAWTHVVFTQLLGIRPLAWHIFELALRWMSAWGFYACLAQIWPSARNQNLSAALIFLIYPTFLQQAAAVTFFQQWLQYALFFFSLYATLRALRAVRAKSRRSLIAWLGTALISMLLQLSVTEYFVPIELIRPVLIWLWLCNQAPLLSRRAKISRALQFSAPFLLVLSGYTVWRLFLMPLPGKDPYRANMLYAFLSEPMATLAQLSRVIAIDVGHILSGSWANAWQGTQITQLQPFLLVGLGVGVLAALAAAVGLTAIPDAGIDDRRRWIKQALILGFVGLILGPIPAWITGRQVVLDFHSNRYALPALFGASLLWMAALEWVAKARLQRAVLVCLLLGTAVFYHLQIGNEYRWGWTAQQRFYWQLYWRAPGIAPSTALVFEKEPFENQGLFSTSAAVNLLYPQPAGMPVDPKTGEPLLGYWVYSLSPRYDSAPDSFDRGLSSQFRTLKFVGNLQDSLLLFNDRQVSNCLWVLSARDASNPLLPKLVREFVPISATGRISEIPTAGYPPEDLFGAEPQPTWCYYFEKADLARQMENWQEVVRLGDQAQSQGYFPDAIESNAPYEWLPFIEGYAMTGNFEQAARITTTAFHQDSRYGEMLCQIWNSLSGASARAAGSSVQDMRQLMRCP